ncbi:antitoxin Xre/MbcA/ParS toxin-binding domain-containing protein [Stenotrophomonas maltophilia]|uniref:antitoxin Xre/MbcA/ParS toxin-binding domain-containing protein n=1 Tax=Stenotrophomonas maltophilia TaxID=40324 RepID=UPI0009C18C35
MPIGADFAAFDAATVDGLKPYLIAIYRALRTIFPNRRQADKWVRRPNAARLFKGHTAIAVMCRGGIDGLTSLRTHLEAGGLIDVQDEMTAQASDWRRSERAPLTRCIKTVDRRSILSAIVNPAAEENSDI